MPFIATCVDAIGMVFWDRPPVILCHFSKNDRSVNFNEGYGFW